MRNRNRALAAAVPCVVALAIVIGITVADRVPASRDPQARVEVAVPSVVPPADSGAPRRTGVAEAAPPATIPQAPVVELTDTMSSSLAPEALRLELEATMLGTIDPGSFLDTALALSKLEVSKSPIPEPHPTGAIRYPLLGLPEGTKAELWLMQSKSGQFQGPRMLYHVSVDLPNPYVFDRAARRALEGQISLWTDTQGKVKHFGVLTESMVSGRSVAMGLPTDNRRVPIGALFTYDAADPQGWRASSSYLDSNNPVEDHDTPPIVKGKWPRFEDLEQLKQGFANQFSKL